MIIVIDVKPENILKNSGGRIILKLEYCTEFSNAAYLHTTDGHTLEDFENNIPKSTKVLTVGRRGGISVE